jgi:hypothetical protein
MDLLRNPPSLVAASKNSTEPMIIDVLPSNIEYQGSWTPTPDNNVIINDFNIGSGPSGTTVLSWNVSMMKCGDVFEVQYDVKSTIAGWQSVGMTFKNASIYSSGYCHVKYRNYNYNKSGSPNDIWTNETPDVSIFVIYSSVPESSCVLCVSFTMIVAFIAVVQINRKKH